MGRLLFPQGKQTIFITSLLQDRKNGVKELAFLCGVSERTICDWRREKFTLPEHALQKIQERFHIPIPKAVTLADYWYGAKGARNGGLRRLALYGPPGTKEGRIKGGKISQLRRKQFPELYPNCPIPKDFTRPPFSDELAEFVGIVLGDGGITSNQLKITLNSHEEKEYQVFVSKLLFKLFHAKPALYQRKNEKACNIALAGVGLVAILSELGLLPGSKVRRQAGVPTWVRNNKKYAVACLRGLMDTDGCVYHHDHISHGVRCFNLGLTFTNRSRPLADFVFQTLLSLNLIARRTVDGVYVYRKEHIDQYFSLVGSHNAYHMQRYANFATIKATKERYPSGLRDTLGERAWP